MLLLDPNPIHDNQYPTFLAEILDGLPSPTVWELHDETVRQRIKEATDYLQGVRANRHRYIDHACHCMLIVFVYIY
jgi:hypothetical protein